VLSHSKDRDEVYRKARELKPIHSAILFFGHLSKDAAIVHRFSERDNHGNIKDHFLCFTDFPNAIKNITLLPAESGEKNSVTSSSKNVSPEAPSRWA
jgi:hypothetical protein